MKLAFGSAVLLAVLALSCSSPEAVEPISAGVPAELGADLATLEVCALIPAPEIESVLGRKLAAPPQRFEYPEATGMAGCTYDAGKNAQNDSFFGYVAFTPARLYDEQPRSQDRSVEGLGRGAYFNNGPDARQLWVKVDDNAALVVAFGDIPNEEGCERIARLLLGRVH